MTKDITDIVVVVVGGVVILLDVRPPQDVPVLVVDWDNWDCEDNVAEVKHVLDKLRKMQWSPERAKLAKQLLLRIQTMHEMARNRNRGGEH